MKPMFFDGTSIPPPDGPTYTTLLISPGGSQASLLVAFMIIGLVISIGFLIAIFVGQKKSAIRSGSVTVLPLMTRGSIPAYVANYLYIGVPSVFKCETTLWLQLVSFVIMSSAMVFKNLRIILIYTTKVKLPKYLAQDWFWALLGSWSVMSKMGVAKVYLPGYIIELKCVYYSDYGFIFGNALWIYNIILILVLFGVTYKSIDVPPIHSEFTMLLVSSLCLAISAVLLEMMKQDSAVDYETKVAGLVFFNTTIIVLMQSVPRILSLIQAEVMGKSMKLSNLKWSFISNNGPEKSIMKTSNNSANAVLQQQPQHQSQQSQSKTTLPPPKKANIISSRVYDAVYCARTWHTPELWSRCVVSFGVVRHNAFLVFHPSRNNLDLSPVVFPELPTNLTASSVVLKLLKDGKLERLEVFMTGGSKLVIDFIKEGDGKEFREHLLKAVEVYKKAV
ncbi:UNVERIFIED_CONTAM: hypothetical protein HDU68_002512 [Siphonaria sp. JEL0065]|nr:hypothetical protein HDU68_002512 [Siphonaria sp. JEL0065]